LNANQQVECHERAAIVDPLVLSDLSAVKPAALLLWRLKGAKNYGFWKTSWGMLEIAGMFSIGFRRRDTINPVQ
jgi:hypothetical protein